MSQMGPWVKGQLISKYLFEKIVWTKIPPKNLIDSALQYFRAETIKFFGGMLVQMIFSKRHFEIKGQLISKRFLEKIIWTKIATKKFDNFCPGGQIKKIKTLYYLSLIHI